MKLQPPLHPRSGPTLEVLVIERISTHHRDIRSFGDQAELVEKYVCDHYPHHVRFEHIHGHDGGEALNRKELAEAEAAIASGRYDLVVAEELSRIGRHRAFDICELCVEVGTRLIAINDRIDTARNSWRRSAYFAVVKIEPANRATDNRIRRSLRERFEQGGVMQRLPFGYLKPPGAQSDADVTKNPAAVAVYEKIFSMLENGAGYAEVAAALNAGNVPLGHGTRSERWTGRMVAGIVHNPIVKGVRRWNQRKNRYESKTGRRQTVKASPEETLYRKVPHLQFIDEARYDRLIKILVERARGWKAV